MDLMSPVTIESARPRKRAGIRAYEIDGEAVLYDLARDSVHYLNRSAWLIWSLCDGSANVGAISQAVAAHFDVPASDRDTPNSIVNDTKQTLRSLAADGLIDLITASCPKVAAGGSDSWAS